jgi:putative YhdH/YhfP family quinone oxidoreductase
VRAFVISENGDELATGVELVDEPGNQEVTVRVTASGINYKDALVVDPSSRVRRSKRLIGGVDAAGVVSSSSLEDIPVGTHVAVHGRDFGTGRNGGFAEFVSVDRTFISVLPETLSAHDAMVFGTAGYTAMASLLALEHHGLQPADGEVLVTGATGGVGSVAVTLLASAGYNVVASTGTPEHATWLTERGAKRIIGRDDIGDQPGRVLGSMRWAGAIDCVGGETLAQILRTLHYGAGVAASGLVGGSDVHTNVFPFITRAVALLGIDAVDASAPTRDGVWKALADTAQHIDVEPLIERTIGLDQIAVALRDIRAGNTRGRILVDPML